ncbi:MAG: hypothetical protein KDA58_13475, partial [Planctomycetaceae bacterium]|nr:hypothetical protein [Planctomycetaceae bacterium]
MTEPQAMLHAEACRCLELRLYRSAVVMMWNLVFECVRRWVFDNKLSDFNKELVSGYTRKNGQAVYEQIVNYSDFWDSQSVGERITLDTCERCKLIGVKLHHRLVGLLNDRNDHAHSNYTEPERER